MHNSEHCGCESGDKCMAEGKVRLHHLIKPVWDELPENIKDMLHSLDTQKIAVLEELKAWADENGNEELADGCDKKIAKINERLDEEN